MAEEKTPSGLGDAAKKGSIKPPLFDLSVCRMLNSMRLVSGCILSLGPIPLPLQVSLVAPLRRERRRRGALRHVQRPRRRPTTFRCCSPIGNVVVLAGAEAVRKRQGVRRFAQLAGLLRGVRVVSKLAWRESFNMFSKRELIKNTNLDSSCSIVAAADAP